MKNVFSGLLLTAFLAGCSSGGGSGSGSGGTPTSKITGNAVGAFSGQTAIFEISNQIANNNKNAASLKNFVFADAYLSATNPTQADVQKKSTNLNRKFQSNACKIKIDQNRNTGAARRSAAESFIPTKMKISGSSCPVEINFDITMTGIDGVNPCQPSGKDTSCKFKAGMKMTYQILDDNLAREMEVRSGHVNMFFDVDQKMPAAQEPSEQMPQMNMQMKSKSNFDLKAVDLSGQAHLISGQQDADIRMMMTIPEQGQGQLELPQVFGGMKEDLQYSQESTGISSTLNGSIVMNGSSGEEKYFIDGVPVTAAVYKEVHAKFENSMIAFNNGGQSEAQNGSPIGGGSQTHYPPEQPQYPQPPQPPSPNENKWACIVQNYSNSTYFIGYGSVEFVATSKAKQACQSNANNNCSTSADCEKQEINPKAWYCEVQNYSNRKIFTGEGASKLEASYLAAKSCADENINNPRSCSSPTNADCVRQ